MTGGNHAPVAVDDTASTAFETSVLVDVLANDSDPDGDSLTLISLSTPTNGQAEIELGAGNVQQIRYTPGAGFDGAATLTYQISDGRGGTGSRVRAPP